MAEIRVCPECDKVFYKGLDRGYAVCSHCQYVLWDQRDSGRRRGEINASFFIDEREVPVRIVDFSTGGLGVIFTDAVDVIPDGVTLKVNADNSGLCGSAKAVWQKRQGDKVIAAGVQFLERR